MHSSWLNAVINGYFFHLKFLFHDLCDNFCCNIRCVYNVIQVQWKKRGTRLRHDPKLYISGPKSFIKPRSLYISDISTTSGLLHFHLLHQIKFRLIINYVCLNINIELIILDTANLLVSLWIISITVIVKVQQKILYAQFIRV